MSSAYTGPLTARERNARWRERQAVEEKILVDKLNAKRAQLNLPPVSLSLPRYSKKGTKRPEYEPPTKMEGDPLKEWKALQRKKRKAAQQAENRIKKSEMVEAYRKQLVDLERIIEEQKKGAENGTKTVDAPGYGTTGCLDRKPIRAKSVGGATADLHLKPVITDEKSEDVMPAVDHKSSVNTATKPVKTLDADRAVSSEGKVKPTEAVGEATADMQAEPAITEEKAQDIMDRALATLGQRDPLRLLAVMACFNSS